MVLAIIFETNFLVQIYKHNAQNFSKKHLSKQRAVREKKKVNLSIVVMIIVAVY
jgi:hypothetical protein